MHAGSSSQLNFLHHWSGHEALVNGVVIGWVPPLDFRGMIAIAIEPSSEGSFKQPLDTSRQIPTPYWRLPCGCAYRPCHRDSFNLCRCVFLLLMHKLSLLLSSGRGERDGSFRSSRNVGLVRNTIDWLSRLRAVSL